AHEPRQRNDEYETGNETHAHEHEQDLLEEDLLAGTLRDAQELHRPPFNDVESSAVEEMDDRWDDQSAEAEEQRRREEAHGSLSCLFGVTLTNSRRVPCPRLCVGMPATTHHRHHAHAKPWAWHPATLGRRDLLRPLPSRQIDPQRPIHWRVRPHQVVIDP